MMFLDCPAYLDQDALRCGLPAEVSCRFTMRSTDGPVESAAIRCPAGHYFCGAIESLTWDRKDKNDPGSAAVTSRSRRVNVQGSHAGRDGTDGSAIRHPPAEPDPEISRPNTAPAYYLGYPARLWITVMRPHHRPAATRYAIEAAVSGGNPGPPVTPRTTHRPAVPSRVAGTVIVAPAAAAEGVPGRPPAPRPAHTPTRDAGMATALGNGI